jgi:threonine dehydrogenase-like Zn-dependent dehydrogenase
MPDQTMTAVYLPGNSTVEFREVPVPTPGHGQVLIKMKASSICGSDIRAIYREHLGKGPEAYQNVVAGHEPCGQVVAVGPGCKEFREGDRAIVYHICGCGICSDCKHGYMISCTSPHRAAYGWQRDGGHAAYLVAEENTLVRLPENLSYTDGALCACGIGTVWEALTRVDLIGKALGARQVIGADIVAERRELAHRLGLCDQVVDAADEAGALDAVLAATDGHGCEASIDCSGSAGGRLLALEGTRQWGRCAFVGEGGTVGFDVSPLLIHKQITLFGSWVTSLKHLSDCVERLSRWGVRPETTVTHRFSLDQAAEAYQVADEGKSGKVVVCFDEELH